MFFVTIIHISSSSISTQHPSLNSQNQLLCYMYSFDEYDLQLVYITFCPDLPLLAHKCI